MHKEKSADYFTAGELASLFNISKQTLIYYDKIKLLSPDFTSANGYRHYSMKQYLDLEIIVNMRALNIGIADIRKYLNCRSKENFLQLLKTKREESERIIKENQNILRTLHVITNNVHSHTQAPPEYTVLCWYDQRKLYITEISKNDSSKNKVLKFVRHSQEIVQSTRISDKLIGWIVKRDAFFSKQNRANSTAYFSFSPPAKQLNDSKEFLLPAGLYLEINFKGTFYQNINSLAEKCSYFLAINNLQIQSDIYVLPIENHWFAENTDNYRNKIFVAVKPIE
ncbi:MAG: MerR family transcriptional regulator [Acidaminococcaceae bacterium]|nr:MerR family transcriptional regulator [Acidaminococcaceae bacterium]